jgi:hypothetical protein
MDRKYREIPTTAGITNGMGGVRLLGFDVRFNETSQAWLDLRPGLNVLYGMNGAGKSTVLQAIKNFSCSEHRAERGANFPTVDLYIEVDNFAHGCAELVSLVFSLLKVDENEDFKPANQVLFGKLPAMSESPLPNSGEKVRIQEDTDALFANIFGAPSFPTREHVAEKLKTELKNLDSQTIEKLSEVDRICRQNFEIRLQKQFSEYEGLSAMILFALKDDSAPFSETYNHGWPNWYVNYLRHSIGSALFFGEPQDPHSLHPNWAAEWTPTKETGELILESDELTFIGKSFGEIASNREPEELLSEFLNFRLQASHLLPHYQDRPEWRRDFETLQEICASGVFRITRSSESGWELCPAARLESLSSTVDPGYRGSQFSPVRSPIDFYLGVSSNRNFVWFNLGGYENQWAIRIKHLPFLVTNGDSFCDPAEYFRNLFAEQIRIYDTKLTDESVRSLQQLADQVAGAISKHLEELEASLLAVRVIVSDALKDWFADSMLRIEYLDGHTNTWLNLSLASSAQRRWVGLAIGLYEASLHRSPMLFVSDEPDQGMHVSSIRSISRVFRELNTTSLITSHSPGALRDPSVHLLHVHRDVLGGFEIDKIESGNDPLVESASLGIDAIDLLPRLKVAIFVEGEHDRAALDTYFSWRANLDGDARIRSFTRIFPSRGVGQMTNLVDAQILLDYTSAKLVIIADNFRTESLLPLVTELREAEIAGAEPKDLEEVLRSWHQRSKGSTRRKNSRNTSFEERTMYDVLRVAIRNRAVKRITIIGIGVKDVIELLPSEAFGLTESWADLQLEYNKSNEFGSVKRSFKEWLRQTRSIEINAKRVAHHVRKACESNSPPAELVRIGNAVFDALNN